MITMKILDINSFCLFQGQDGHITDLDERFEKSLKSVNLEVGSVILLNTN